jgi:diaminopimelate decarboxylase
VVFPEVVLQNRASFSAELSSRGIAGQVLYTSKPNRSSAILAALAESGAPVDVSSAGALRHTLSQGVPGHRIQASGPKNLDYAYLALAHGVTVSVDSISELEMIEDLVRSDTSLPPAQLLLRLSGFTSERVRFPSSDTPFGIRLDDVDTVLERFDRFGDRATFLGTHFHLLGGEREERLVAFENSLDTIRRAYRLGLRPRILNIGGGFKIRYAEHNEEWLNFQSYLRASLLGKVEPITWDGTGLGLRLEQGRVVGNLTVGDHYPTAVGAQEFGAFLDTRSPYFDHCPVGELVRDMMLELRVEPGRALLDQAGFTVTEVVAVKESAAGTPLLMVSMNHTNLLSREQKLLTQPVFIPRSPREKSTASYFIFGNLCIASDLIQYQKVYPGFSLGRGDLVAFINTAAYHMDFAESEILHQHVARKVAAFERQGDFISLDDDVVNPVLVRRIRSER